MALGFGFNKAKVLASAEKYVQQGRLQNAITDYLKIVKEDPKDLTVMNTVGDLYARLGQPKEAIQYFKQVGEGYAVDGFTVKAIAIYKKLTKLDPSVTDCVFKLAELYSQQGLYNDARSQYLTLADRCVRAGDKQQASRIFQKLVELDPENAAMQNKLADLYLELGNKEEARNILFSAAESLFRRGAMEAADEALARVLSVDPNYPAALMLRAQIAVEGGKPETVVELLQQIPNLDSQPEALRTLLRANLRLGNQSEALPIANKLLSVHNDASGIDLCIESLLCANEFDTGLRLCEQHADRLLATDHAGLMARISAVISRVHDNAAALEIVLKLYRKAGETSGLTEIMELLAHALVQAGELVRARDLYNELAQLEPENPLHAQNCKQVSAKLGDDAATRPLSDAEGAQALMVDELEIDSPRLQQQYPEEIARALRTALTDSELLDSYNLPAKAIAPLETVLPSAPRDPLINQRLASLYVRAERYSDAARCCDVLHAVYQRAGYGDLAAQYAEMATKYHERAGEAAPEYSPEHEAEPPVKPEPAEIAVPDSTLTSSDTPPPEPETAHEITGPKEIDLSGQWEEMTIADSSSTGSSVLFDRSKPAEITPGDIVGDLLEEIRFYILQSMWDEAEAAIKHCEELASGLPELEELRQQVAKSRSAAPPTPQIELLGEEQPSDLDSATLVFDGAEYGMPDEQVTAPQQPIPQEMPRSSAEPVFSQHVARTEEEQEEQARPTRLPVQPAAATAAVPAAGRADAYRDDELADLVSDLEQTLGADFGLASPSAKPTPAPAAARPAPAVAVPSSRVIPPEPVAVPVIPAAAAAIMAPAARAQSSSEQSSSTLAEIFEEFKEDVESANSTDSEDPETHYNLGVAFKDMGLLDEAIGELQKVCHAIEGGVAFPQALQVYTWLAQCLMMKGAPQAAVKWYQRALQLPVDGETSMAVYYEMAAAYEQAGNRQAALDNFMEVYANNIDYRDVAERIKTLKA